MKRAPFFLLGLLLALVGAGAAGAQAALPETPLVLLVDNNLYAWTPEQAAPTMLTMNGFIEPPSVSPDGTEIAYAAYAPLTIDAIQRVGGIGGGSMPADIWVMNPTTRQTREIAVQPENASFFTDGVEDYAVTRSQPAWSWDGMKLAWGEHFYPTEAQRLAIYDFATGSVRFVENLPEQAAVSGPMSLTWVGAFIVVRSIDMDGEALMVFDAEGNAVQTIRLPEEVQIRRFEAVQQNGSYTIGVMGFDDQWTLYDPLHGTQEPVVGYVEMYAWLAAETSLGLEPRYDEAGAPIWQAVDSLGRPVERFSSAGYYSTEAIRLSPDGQTVAYSEYNADTRVYEDVVRVVRGQSGANVPDVMDDPFVDAFAWGPMAWRTRLRSTPAGANAPIMANYPAQTPLPITDDVTGIDCPGAPTPRLLPGDLARVLGTTANNVRSQPSVTSGAVVGQIPAGAQFNVLEGPACQDELTWYRVQYGDLTGWTAEGQGREYWVEPLG